MKLLFLTEFFPKDNQLIFTGGVEARVYYLVNQAKKDFKVEIITSHSKQIPATPLSIFNRIYYIFKSFFKALKVDFDLIEASNFVTYLPAFLAGRVKKKPTIAWIPDILGRHWFDFGFFVGVLGFLLEKISLSLPWTHIIALSDSTKTKLINQGINSKKITVIRAGINPKEFKLNKTIKKFPIFTIVCIARLVNTKRIFDLIKAFRSLKKTQLIIIGQGPKKKSLVNLAKKLNLIDKVKFLSNLKREKLIKTLYQSHLFCLPSVVEGFGIVTIEAMAAGLPVILADLPINQEITKQGQGALFFKPQNPTDLAKKLNTIKSNHSLYQQKKLQAKKLSNAYTWRKIYQQTKKVYENYSTD